MKQPGFHKFFRLLAAVSIFMVLLYGVAALHSYFETSSEQIEQLGSQNPYFIYGSKLIWQDDQLKHEKSPSTYIRDDIATAYKNAWYYLNKYQKSGDSTLLDNYFHPDLASKLQSDSSFGTIQRAAIRHHLVLRHYSFDQQFVAFSDTSSLYIERIVNNDTDRFCQDIAVCDFDVIMTLDDGRWRIRHLVRRKLAYQKPDIVNRQSTHDQLQGINYYPADYPWKDFWLHFDSDIIQKDFQLVSDLGLNAVRVFVPFEIFGGRVVNQDRLDDLGSLFAIASANDIQVVVTLFDFPVGYDLNQYAEYDQHLESLLSLFGSHPAVAHWDVKNEPDQDFKYQGKAETLAWLEFMIARARVYAPDAKLTIGWSSIEQAHRLSDHLDLISAHYYESEKTFAERLKKLKYRIGNKPLVVQEFGWPSDPYFGLINHRDRQRDYLQSIVDICNAQDISWLLWTLYDFRDAPSDVFGWKPWVRHKQKSFGLLTADRKAKAALQIIDNQQISIEKAEDFQGWIAWVLLIIVLVVIICSVLWLLNLRANRKVENG